MAHEHNYKLTTVWTGNKGDGTKNVRAYDRSHTVSIEGKPELLLTTDNPAVGDKSKLSSESANILTSNLNPFADKRISFSIEYCIVV